MSCTTWRMSGSSSTTSIRLLCIRPPAHKNRRNKGDVGNIVNPDHPLFFLHVQSRPAVSQEASKCKLASRRKPIKNELRTVPAIVMSANLPRSELQERHLVGVEKPFDLDDLLQTIEHVLASSS